MANIMDLFSPTEVVETEFNLSGIREAYEKIRKAQETVGGKPMFKAKVGAGGVKVFTIACGGREMVKESFRGVVIAHHHSNARFASGDDAAENQNTPPVCASTDGKTGVVYETGECKSCESCPYNIFGTAGAGKACKNMHRLYILVEGCPIPLTLTLPPTSLELWRNYALMDVAAAGLEMAEVVTEFSLTATTNAAGQRYSIVNFKLLGKVNGDVSDFCAQMGASLEQAPRLAIEADEYNREVALPEAPELPKEAESLELELDEV